MGVPSIGHMDLYKPDKVLVMINIAVLYCSLTDRNDTTGDIVENLFGRCRIISALIYEE